ncbi:MAG: hypothetical protein IKP86_13405 [Anaerolineaceae bacterium]|nr:hypothetical protein [Anaerolineaceae bacterium]
MENLKKGEMIRFGRYPQKRDPSAAPEPIEWIVLDTDGKSAKLISRYGLTAKPYNEDGYWPVTWESCTLRSWLNHEFVDAAFTDAEQRLLEPVTVEAEYCQFFTGKDTVDRVFVPDDEEAEQYFLSDAERICIPTEKAISEGAYTGKKPGTGCWWWLRTPSISMPNFVYVVETDGSFDKDGFPVNTFDENGDGNITVRPAVVLRPDR